MLKLLALRAKVVVPLSLECLVLLSTSDDKEF
jgi:hypothetical protein